MESHKNITISVEMDEMRGFYHGKKRQIWLWRAIGHTAAQPLLSGLGRGNIRILTSCWNCLSRLT
jgi:IS1 family transposase